MSPLDFSERVGVLAAPCVGVEVGKDADTAADSGVAVCPDGESDGTAGTGDEAILP